MNNSNTLSLYRVYSPFKPSLVARVFAHGVDEAQKLAKEMKPALARFTNLRAITG